LIHAGALFCMARRQAGQHELANGFSIPPQTWAQPLRRGIPPGGWSLGLGSGSEFNRLTGRVSASIASRVLPVKGFGLAARTLLYSIFRDTDVPPIMASHGHAPVGVGQGHGHAVLLQLHSPRVPSPHELPTVLPSSFEPGRRQRDYCAIRKASGGDSRGLPTQVPRRISSQLKRDCADPRQRSKSIIAASQNLRPMTCRRGLWVFGATIENRSSPSASSASCGRRLNKVVRPGRAGCWCG
jgi:hypothetical protein